jgi:hypothetical protein
MRNLLAFLAAVTLTILCLGWYLDWYHIRTSPASSGHRNFTIDVDTIKVSEDLYKGGAKIQEVLEKNRKDQASQAAKEKADGKGPEEKPKPEEKHPPVKEHKSGESGAAPHIPFGN